LGSGGGVLRQEQVNPENWKEGLQKQGKGGGGGHRDMVEGGQVRPTKRKLKKKNTNGRTRVCPKGKRNQAASTLLWGENTFNHERGGKVWDLLTTNTNGVIGTFPPSGSGTEGLDRGTPKRKKERKHSQLKVNQASGEKTSGNGDRVVIGLPIKKGEKRSVACESKRNMRLSQKGQNGGEGRLLGKVPETGGGVTRFVRQEERHKPCEWYEEHPGCAKNPVPD